MSEKYGIPVGELKKRLPELLHRVEELHEFNPMLGHRGCRLGITYPEITEMQARAIFEAAVLVAKKGDQGDSRSDDSAGRQRQGTGESEGTSWCASPRKFWTKAGHARICITWSAP